MPESSPPPAALVRYRDIDWDRPLETPGVPKPPAALVEAARRAGARRKRLVRGEAGFYMNRSQMPPGFEVPPHSHDCDELLVVLSGGCRLTGELGELGPDDAIVIRANTRYGFTCGPEGMDFLTIRAGEAALSLAE